MVNEQTTHTGAVAEAEELPAPVITQFRTVAALPDLDVRALAVTPVGIYAGTANGIEVLRPGETVFTKDPIAQGPVVDLEAGADGVSLLVARPDEVDILNLDLSGGQGWTVTGKTIISVTSIGSDVYLGTSAGLSHIGPGGDQPVAALAGVGGARFAVTGQVVWMATSAGVKRDAPRARPCSPI